MIATQRSIKFGISNSPFTHRSAMSLSMSFQWYSAHDNVMKNDGGPCFCSKWWLIQAKTSFLLALQYAAEPVTFIEKYEMLFSQDKFPLETWCCNSSKDFGPCLKKVSTKNPPLVWFVCRARKFNAQKAHILSLANRQSQYSRVLAIHSPKLGLSFVFDAQYPPTPPGKRHGKAFSKSAYLTIHIWVLGLRMGSPSLPYFFCS